MNFRSLQKEVHPYFMIIVGLIIATTGWACFIIPSHVVGGGITGISTMLFYLFGLDVGMVSLILNGILIVLAIKIVGTSFGIKTIFTVVLYSVALSVLTKFFPEPLIQEKMLATITGSLLAGFGGGIILMHGGSTGGTEIVTMIISKYKNISFGKELLKLDAFIIGSSLLVFRQIDTTVYGFMVMAIFTYTIDLVLSGTKQTVQIFIFSKKNEAVKNLIITELKRGVTILPGKGGFTNEDVNVLMVIARKSESTKILKIIHDIDSDAFITMGSVMGVFGNGFDTIKG